MKLLHRLRVKEAHSWRHGARHSVYVQVAAIGWEDVTLSILQVSTGQLIAAVSVPIHGVDFGAKGDIFLAVVCPNVVDFNGDGASCLFCR